MRDTKYILNYKLLGCFAIFLLLMWLILPDNLIHTSEHIGFQWGSLGYQIKLFALFFGITLLVATVIEFLNYKLVKTKRNWISALHVYGSVISIVGVNLGLIMSHNDVTAKRYYRFNEFGEVSNLDIANKLITIFLLIFVITQLIFVLEFIVNMIRSVIQKR